MNSVTKVKYIYNQDKNNETKKITSSSTIYKTIYYSSLGKEVTAKFYNFIVIKS